MQDKTNGLVDKLQGLVEEEVEYFKKVNQLDYILEKLESGEITVDEVSKFARISARQGMNGEEIVTIMENGLKETKNKVELDEKTGEPGWIVTNPGGEQYVVADSVFKKKYEIDPENMNQYKPKGGPVLSAKVDENIEFTAPWGEAMKIQKGGSLIIGGENDIYGIQKKEFEDTYASTGKNPQENVEKLKEVIGFEKAMEGKRQDKVGTIK